MGEFAQGLGLLLDLVRFEMAVFFLGNGISVMINPTTSYSIYQTGDNTTSPSHGIDPLSFGNTSRCDKPGEPKHFTHIANLEFYLAVCMLGLMAAILLIKHTVDAIEEAEKLQIAAAIRSATRAVKVTEAKFIAAKQALEDAEKAVDEARDAVASGTDTTSAAASPRLEEKKDFASKLRRSRDVAQNMYSHALDQEIAAGVPKGIARLANAERKVLRCSVFLLHILSIWCTVLGVWTFTDVLDYKLGCKKAFHSNPSMLVSLAILTVIMGLVYLRLVFIAARKN